MVSGKEQKASVSDHQLRIYMPGNKHHLRYETTQSRYPRQRYQHLYDDETRIARQVSPSMPLAQEHSVGCFESFSGPIPRRCVVYVYISKLPCRMIYRTTSNTDQLTSLPTLLVSVPVLLHSVRNRGENTPDLAICTPPWLAHFRNPSTMLNIYRVQCTVNLETLSCHHYYLWRYDEMIFLAIGSSDAWQRGSKEG